ncbi:ribonuclease HI [Cystobacter ferrugineus]|uniref:Ribonuclease H n=1 Tax=Cystobacter ferrugineus TaxID=83449 RepID=A0A1L9AUL4_9BACT|nr:ribonuclease HI [Cystobacter ferrugineus]OJH33623.1 ribonuclease HI [Cystobacter ferrugineus]
MQTRPYVEIYTDGACSPNPGWGGWAAILVSPQHNRHTKEITGAEQNTTNNRMELTAAIKGLQALKVPSRVRLTTDSTYVSKAFQEGWLENWKAKGWRTAARSPVQNADLWRELDQLSAIHEIEWQWVRGHANHPENARADELAVAAREALRRDVEGQGAAEIRR